MLLHYAEVSIFTLYGNKVGSLTSKTSRKDCITQRCFATDLELLCWNIQRLIQLSGGQGECVELGKFCLGFVLDQILFRLLLILNRFVEVSVKQAVGVFIYSTATGQSTCIHTLKLPCKLQGNGKVGTGRTWERFNKTQIYRLKLLVMVYFCS